VSTITSSREAFLGKVDLEQVSHVNVCGGNVPEHAEVTAEAVGSFDTVVVDDLAQAKAEYGDLIQAASSGRFAWESASSSGQWLQAEPRGRAGPSSSQGALPWKT